MVLWKSIRKEAIKNDVNSALNLFTTLIKRRELNVSITTKARLKKVWFQEGGKPNF